MRTTEEVPQYKKVLSYLKKRTSRRIPPARAVTCWTQGCVFVERVEKVLGVDKKGRDIVVIEVFKTVRGIRTYNGRTNWKGDGIVHVHE
ncbi:hypothetical protein LCGC14_1076200 [marine sediment metagenome]|uniref:Uncharacterized protein n=1 Tax=marine sediment metagenome TaxID=412755 RepID=A0A0F9PZS5_9ZZZZ